MAQVSVTASRTIAAAPERVLAALRDYAEVRPAILTEHYSDYRLEAGGQGAGTRVHWTLAATSKRVRDQLLAVTEDRGSVVESDQNSSMVTRWTVAPTADGSSTVAVHTTWDGAGGIGGFFERTFAPPGLRKIYDGVLGNLEGRLVSGA